MGRLEEIKALMPHSPIILRNGKLRSDLEWAVGEIERLQILLQRCWPAVWDWEYGDTNTTIDTRKLLEDMDEFMAAQAGKGGGA